LLEGTGLVFQARDLKFAGNEGAVSFYEQRTTYGYSWWLRNGLLAASIAAAMAIAVTGTTAPAALLPLAVTTFASAILGRALFYAVVIPTTLPGAFFWRNRGFAEHAREVGLAAMPQLGVTHERHHPFRLDELWRTLRETSFKEVRAQIRRIVTG
jgi:hypothetical protein